MDAEALDGGVRLSLGARRGCRANSPARYGDARRGARHPRLHRRVGTSAHTCPYCDGFEHRDERLAVLAAGARGEHLAILLRQWSDDVVLLSNGPHDLAADQLARVQALGIPIIETPVVALDSDETAHLRRVRLNDGESLDRDALFFYVGWHLRTEIARDAGLRAARRRLHRRRRKPGDDRRAHLRRRQLHRPAGACPGGRRLRRHSRRHDQRAPELRRRRSSRRRPGCAVARRQGALTPRFARTPERTSAEPPHQRSFSASPRPQGSRMSRHRRRPGSRGAHRASR